MMALDTPASRAMSAMRVAAGPRVAKARQAAARMFSRARDDRLEGHCAGLPAAPLEPVQQSGVGSAFAADGGDLLLHAQGGLVAHSELAGEGARRQAPVAGGDEAGGREPGGHAQARAFHEGAGGGVDLGAAVVAGVGPAAGDAVKPAHRVAAAAHGTSAVGRVEGLPQPGQAGGFVPYGFVERALGVLVAAWRFHLPPPPA